ncbi:MAG: Rpn family recombination-promoting nuclease/putative transposase [bacterium]|nr:Rpn family recombination-promoting nuclease/putative transposase [bacterium]
MPKERKLISFDWAIKRILRNKANFGILEGFLSELLLDDITIKKILESESNREAEKAYSNHVDLLVENSKNELIITEIQNDTGYNFFRRIIAGASRHLGEYLESGMPYSKVRKVISINLVYFDLGQGEDYVYQGKTQFVGLNKKDILKLSELQQQIYKTDKIADIFPEYYILKINNFDDVARNTIDEWIYFFQNDSIKDEFTAKGLKEAQKELDILKMSEEERSEYEDYHENLHYEASMHESTYTVGVIEGEKKWIEKEREEGIEKGIREMTMNLKKSGVDIEVIIQASGLSSEEIENL